MPSLVTNIVTAALTLMLA